VGFWKSLDDLMENWQVDKRWRPQMEEPERARLYRTWQKAISRSLDWVD
jgi:glycerol kinase